MDPKSNLDDFFGNSILAHEFERNNKLKSLTSVSSMPKLPITRPSFGLRQKLSNEPILGSTYKPIDIKPLEVDFNKNMEKPSNPLFVRIMDNYYLKETQPLDPLYFGSSSSRKTTIETRFDNINNTRAKVGYSSIGNNASIGTRGDLPNLDNFTNRYYIDPDR